MTKKQIEILRQKFFDECIFENEIFVSIQEIWQFIEINCITNDSKTIFNFFMWFRENGEKYMNESIEKMIQIYLKESD